MLDDDRAKVRSLQAALTAAQSQAKAAQAGISAARTQVTSAEANVRALQATLARIDVELADSELKARAMAACSSAWCSPARWWAQVPACCSWPI